jgi:hypothetical protein
MRIVDGFHTLNDDDDGMLTGGRMGSNTQIEPQAKEIAHMIWEKIHSSHDPFQLICKWANH